ncbi:Non-canonical poly(A) RNA polymerase PAPD5 [Mycena kentingensis (nom. inval.)]|nr:Non-canonical poly(A) RNA polymerase PAPD5 [Mycena kentingensis (nom. inval.)]
MEDPDRGRAESRDPPPATSGSTTAQPQRPTRPKKRKRSPSPREPLTCPWLLEMDSDITERSYTTTEHKLHDEILAFVDYVQETPQEKHARESLVGVLRRLVRVRLSGAELKVHGSAVTGLALPGGDVDLVVVIPGNMTPKDTKRILYVLVGVLKSSGIAEHACVVRARVPIVQFKTGSEYGSLDGDICVNNLGGIQALSIVEGYLSAMPALRPLVLLVKTFLAQRRLNNPAVGGLGSYAVVCMCISFLQLNPNKRPQEYLDKPMETKSLGALLIDFFFHYGLTFPYTSSYISVSTGGLLPKASANWITTKEPDFLVIQCLVDPTNNASSAAYKIEAIRKAFKDAYTTQLMHSVDDETLLSPMIALTQSMADHRARIHDLVDSGTLATGEGTLTGVTPYEPRSQGSRAASRAAEPVESAVDEDGAKRRRREKWKLNGEGDASATENGVSGATTSTTDDGQERPGDDVAASQGIRRSKRILDANGVYLIDRDFYKYEYPEGATPVEKKRIREAIKDGRDPEGLARRTVRYRYPAGSTPEERQDILRDYRKQKAQERTGSGAEEKVEGKQGPKQEPKMRKRKRKRKRAEAKSETQIETEGDSTGERDAKRKRTTPPEIPALEHKYPKGSTKKEKRRIRQAIANGEDPEGLANPRVLHYAEGMTQKQRRKMRQEMKQEMKKEAAAKRAWWAERKAREIGEKSG